MYPTEAMTPQYVAALKKVRRKKFASEMRTFGIAIFGVTVLPFGLLIGLGFLFG